MTKKEMELRIQNLEESVSTLAKKSHDMDSENESKISDVKTSAEQMNAELEEQLLVTDETAVELYETLIAQEEINIAQDETLVEIYEMMEGGETV